jgi:hypothetical protein
VQVGFGLPFAYDAFYLVMGLFDTQAKQAGQLVIRSLSIMTGNKKDEEVATNIWHVLHLALIKRVRCLDAPRAP